MERAETHSSVPYVHSPALQRAVKTLIFVDFEKKREIRPGAAPVEPLNGIIGVTLYEISWVTWPYEEMPCRTPTKNRYMAVENPLKRAIFSYLM